MNPVNSPTLLSIPSSDLAFRTLRSLTVYVLSCDMLWTPVNGILWKHLKTYRKTSCRVLQWPRDFTGKRSGRLSALTLYDRTGYHKIVWSEFKARLVFRMHNVTRNTLNVVLCIAVQTRHEKPTSPVPSTMEWGGGSESVQNKVAKISKDCLHRKTNLLLCFNAYNFLFKEASSFHRHIKIRVIYELEPYFWCKLWCLPTLR